MRIPSRSHVVRAAFAAIGFLGSLASAQAQVSLGTTSHFVQPGEFAIGVDPSLTLASGNAGLGLNLRYTQGISDLLNAQAIVGTGGNDRKFRAGGNVTFDFFPDTEGQPGIGITAQSIYYRIGSTGQVDIQGIPYIHKSFTLSGGSEVEPYLGIPVGMAFSDGRYKAISQVAVGSMFKSSEKLRYNMELGIAVNNTETYFSGGMTYYH